MNELIKRKERISSFFLEEEITHDKRINQWMNENRQLKREMWVGKQLKKGRPSCWDEILQMAEKTEKADHSKSI